MRIHIVTTGLLALGLAAGGHTTTTADADKTAEILGGTRKAIGDKKLDTLKSLSVNATLQRNVGNMQINSDVELMVELPDKYARSETTTGPVSGSNTTGFNGDKLLTRANSPMVGGGGGMIIRMGPGGGAFGGPGSDVKPTPEEQEKMNAAMLRSSRQELSRLMLGWFAMAHPSINAEYSYAGEAESPDGKAYVIDAKNADGFAARLFIDQQTHLPLMLTYQGPQPRMITMGGPGRGADGRQGAPGGGQGRAMTPPTEEERKKMREEVQKQMAAMEKEPPKMIEYTIYFDDWREEDGVKFPHTMRRASGGTTSEEWTITKVKVNPKIDAKKFAIES
jgi:hypothetical protein